MDRGLVGYSTWGCKELDMTERLSTHLHKVLLSSWLEDWEGKVL